MLSILNYDPGKSKDFYKWILIAFPVAALVFFIFFLFLTESANNEENMTPEAVAGAGVEMTDTTRIIPNTALFDNADENTGELKNPGNPRSEGLENNSPEPDNVTIQQAGPKTQDQLLEDARSKALILDSRITPLYNKLNAGLDNMIRMATDPSVSAFTLLEAMRKQGELEDNFYAETLAIIDEMFPGISERERFRILGMSKVYTEYKRRATPEEEKIGREIERKLREEKNRETNGGVSGSEN